MDSTANEVDVPGLAVSGFPTIYFFKGSDKTKPIKYEVKDIICSKILSLDLNFLMYLKRAQENSMASSNIWKTMLIIQSTTSFNVTLEDLLLLLLFIIQSSATCAYQALHKYIGPECSHD